jgi:hypothetical protein
MRCLADEDEPRIAHELEERIEVGGCADERLGVSTDRSSDRRRRE